MKLSFPEYHLFQLLKRFDNQYLSLDLFLNQYFRAHKQLGSKDRQTISNAVYGMFRWQSLLDHLTEGQPSWEKRYALFRGFQPSQFLYIDSIPLHVRVSFPKELFSLLVENYGKEKAIYLCQVCNTQAPTVVRINPLKTTRDYLLLQWKKFDPIPCQYSPLGIQFKKRIPLVSLPEFKKGLFEIQDEASQCAAKLIDVQPEQSVLDYCAGSGGKTLAFAPLMKNQGQIYLHDTRPYILEQAKKRLQRAGIQNAKFLYHKHHCLKTLRKKMDWVLVDVPCTGTGTLRRNPDQKWKFSLVLLNQLIEQQRLIFETALKFVKPGGSIVYATCSFLHTENERQVAYFSNAYNIKVVGDPFISLPNYGQMDGFFATRFEIPDKTGGFMWSTHR